MWELFYKIKQFAEGHMYINEYDPNLDSFAGVVSVGDKVECVVMDELPAQEIVLKNQDLK